MLRNSEKTDVKAICHIRSVHSSFVTSFMNGPIMENLRVAFYVVFQQCSMGGQLLQAQSAFIDKATRLQSPKKWLVRGLVKFAPAVARLVCPDLLG